MRTIDFSPLYRSVVGFDRLAALLETAAKTEPASNWPPYNIETTGEDSYRIELAVAGFKADELNIEVKENLLTVTGRKTANDDAARRYLHRGLAERDFERRFQLADYVIVTAPLTGLTRNMMSRERLGMMKADVGLINVSRAALVDYAALADHMRRGHLSGAILDVHSPEPLAVDSALWDTPNVMITPHISCDEDAGHR